MNYLIFDTETTGLPKKYKESITKLDNWPRIVQIAWMLINDEKNIIDSAVDIIKPVGFEIPLEVSNIHGITHAKAREEGIPIAQALEPFSAGIAKADLLVGHNIDFDTPIVAAEYIRLTGSIPLAFMGKKKTCTMKSATDFCAIPKKRGAGFKWPKLLELHIKLFGTGFDGAHDAWNDVAATAACFFELKEKGIIS